jgi:hypothetical protein
MIRRPSTSGKARITRYGAGVVWFAGSVPGGTLCEGRAVPRDPSYWRKGGVAGRPEAWRCFVLARVCGSGLAWS